MESNETVSTARSRWIVVVLVLLGWMFAALIASARPGVEILNGGRVRQIPVTSAFVDNLINYGWWALLAPLIIYVVSRIATSPLTLPAQAILQLAAAAFFIPLYFTLRSLVRLPFTPYNIAFNGNTMLAMLPHLVGVYGIIASVTMVFVAYRRLLMREKQLVEARLQALGAQLHPHFLSNALNGIAALVESRPSQARFMIARLGELLRAAVDASQQRETLLTAEMEWLERYLEVQQVRFDDRIDVTVQMSPDVVHSLVPPLILQPIVENAIKHGIEGRTDGGRVRIQADRQGDVLRLRVGNDRATLPARNGASGVGLQNVRDRLHALFGSHQSLELVETDDWVETEITLPFRTAVHE